MKYAFISFAHSGSVLPLVKQLAQKGHYVDCYFICNMFQKSNSFEAFEVNSIIKIPIIQHLKYHKNKLFYDYFNSKAVTLLLFILPPALNRFKNKFLKNNYTNFTHLLIRRNLYFIKKRNYDCIHIIGHDVLTILFHQVLEKNYRVHTLHEVFIDHYKQKTLSSVMEYLIKHNIPTVVPSQYTYNELELSGISSNVFLVRFGLFETYNLFSSDCVIDEIEKIDNFILFYGNIVPYKGLSILYDAIQIVKKEIPNIKAIIAGNGNDFILTKMKIDPNYIIINRRLENSEIVKLNKQARIVVCPYLSASQSGIPQTSFLFQKPVLASNVGAFGEIIRNGKNGYLFEISDAISLSNLILKLYKNISLYEMLKRNVAEFPTSEQPEYMWKNIAQKYECIFNKQFQDT